MEGGLNMIEANNDGDDGDDDDVGVVHG